MKRLLLMIIATIVFAVLTVLDFLLLSFPYSIIIFFVPFGVYYVLIHIMWRFYILQFPLNDYNEYKISIKELMSTDTIIINNVHNIYYCSVGNVYLTFNMKYCICPIMYIRAYFIRQFLFKHFEKNKIPPDKLDKNYRVLDSNYNLKLKYRNKMFFLIKKGITKQNYLIKITNVLNFTRIIRIPRTLSYKKEYYKISEMDFVKSKSNVSFKKHLNKE